MGAMPINDNVQIDDGDRPDIGNSRSAFQRKVTVESLLKYLPNGLRKTSTWWTIALSQLQVEEPAFKKSKSAKSSKAPKRSKSAKSSKAVRRKLRAA
eukprot:scaffold1573_cov132-Chaetoceros_neogracile.AAC.4